MVKKRTIFYLGNINCLPMEEQYLCAFSNVCMYVLYGEKKLLTDQYANINPKTDVFSVNALLISSFLEFGLFLF